MVVDERLVTYIDSLDSGNTEILDTIEKEALDSYVPIIRKSMQSFLKLLLAMQKPKRILEVGTAVGFSAILMAEYNPYPCEIVTIENYDKRIPIARENFKRAGKEQQITLLEGDATEVLKTLDEPFDMIFMDAAKGQYINFFGDVMRLLKKDGVLVSDNVLQDGDIIESHFVVTRRNRTIHKRMREYLYELTQDETLLPLAIKYTNNIEETKNLTWHHDVGFMVNCSFGNGLRIADVPGYKDIMIQTAHSLSTRFRPQAGVIQSWDVKGGWQAERGWECPVIIDNMMNLELLFEVTRLSGDSTFHHLALQHADRTLKEHFRPDGSCYHVIDYSLADGSVRHRHTAQGYAHESIWSRGQAWAIYGYTICYRYTKDKRYLDQALKTFHMMANHPNMPEDLVPYWDMLAPEIPNEPRDVSSASCIASALYEIAGFEELENAKEYKDYADRIMTSLASPAYRAEIGQNNNFLLMHSVGSIPHNAEVDKPLNYADYYFIEALKRKNDLEK